MSFYFGNFGTLSKILPVAVSVSHFSTIFCC